MKHVYLFFLFFTSLLFSQEAYYNDIPNLSSLDGQDLYLALQNKISSASSTFTYGDNRDTMKTTDDEDFDDTDGNDTSTTLWLMYGYDDSDMNCTTDRTRDENDYGGATCLYNREHVFARSLADPPMGDAVNSAIGIVADPHNIRPSDYQMNSDRGNLEFAFGSGNAGVVSGLYWYPGDEWKGDVARIIMYMYTRYGDQCLPEYVGNGNKEGTTNMLQLFLQWNVDDPVSAFEYQRNEYLETVYGNRNPFIDDPYLATKIWGGPAAEDTWGILSTKDAPTINFKMYPNPVKNDFLFFSSTQDLKVIVYDVLGKQVEIENINPDKNFIDVSALHKGIYLVRLISKDGQVTRKLIRQ